MAARCPGHNSLHEDVWWKSFARHAVRKVFEQLRNYNDKEMKISRELKIGVFVVVVLTATFFIINFLRGEDIFNREILLRARYADVEGLVPSAPVYIKGYKAGSVAAIEYIPEADLFEVECSVLRQFVIPEDSKLVIYGVDIMGGKGVRVDAGVSGTMAEDGALLEGGYEPDLLSALGDGIVPLFAKAGTVLDSLSVAVSNVNGMLGEGNRESLSRTLVHLESTLANAERISASVGGKSDELDAFIANLVSVSSKLEGVADKADTVMANVGGITRQLSESDLEGLVVSLRGLLEKLQDPDGTIGKLMSEDSAYRNIDSLLADVDSLIKEIEKNPKKYIRISIF